MDRLKALLIFTSLFMLSIAVLEVNATSDVKLFICADCLGNETLCRDTCLGFYCYKYEVEGPTGKCVKRGCGNNSDPLAKVNECTPPTSEIGRLQEKFIICRPDLCNNSPSHFIFSVICFILFSLIRIIS